MLKAIVFDIGQTLVNYNKPLNWSELYRPAFESISEKCGYTFSDSHYQHAGQVLTKYNTRINPRDYEVTSDQLFNEILNGMDRAFSLISVVSALYLTTCYGGSCHFHPHNHYCTSNLSHLYYMADQYKYNLPFLHKDIQAIATHDNCLLQSMYAINQLFSF